MLDCKRDDALAIFDMEHRGGAKGLINSGLGAAIKKGGGTAIEIGSNLKEEEY